VVQAVADLLLPLAAGRLASRWAHHRHLLEALPTRHFFVLLLLLLLLLLLRMLLLLGWACLQQSRWP
jgi:hypothetical protein